MPAYYVNNNAQSNGDHEVHKDGCSYMPTNKTYLGVFDRCKEAVSAAKTKYAQSNGCYYCSRECHTS